MLRIGDAANVADPLTGDGIGHALKSGRLAAEAIDAVSSTQPKIVTTQESLAENQRSLKTLLEGMAPAHAKIDDIHSDVRDVKRDVGTLLQRERPGPPLAGPSGGSGRSGC